MCTKTNANRVLHCQLGDLKAGERYRTPEGRTLMVLSLMAQYDGYVRVADVESGEVFNPSTSIKLGHDEQGRLYASRWLNPPTKGDQSRRGYVGVDGIWVDTGTRDNPTKPNTCKCGNHKPTDAEECTTCLLKAVTDDMSIPGGSS